MRSLLAARMMLVSLATTWSSSSASTKASLTLIGCMYCHFNSTHITNFMGYINEIIIDADTGLVPVWHQDTTRAIFIALDWDWHWEHSAPAKTRACIDNPAHHALHEVHRTTRDLYAPMPNRRGGMTRPPAPPIGLKVEEAMTSAEINAELVCPLRTPNFPPGTHDYAPKRHDLIEGVSKCMISGQEAQAKFNEYRETKESHDEVYTYGSKMNEKVGAAAVINRHFQNGETTCRQLSKRQQHHLCSWGYSHQSGTELLPTHGPSPSWCDSLLWLNVLFASNWGWRHREPFYLPYHAPTLVIEWQGHTCSFLLGTKPLWHWRKWKSGPTS